MDRIGIPDRQVVAHPCPLRGTGVWERTTKFSLYDGVCDSSEIGNGETQETGRHCAP